MRVCVCLLVWISNSVRLLGNVLFTQITAARFRIFLVIFKPTKYKFLCLCECMFVLHPLKLYITPTPARYFRGNRKKGKILIDTCVGVCLSESVCLFGCVFEALGVQGGKRRGVQDWMILLADCVLSSSRGLFLLLFFVFFPFCFNNLNKCFISARQLVYSNVFLIVV